MRGNSRYAGGARRVALAGAVVVALAGAGTVLELGLVEGSGPRDERPSAGPSAPTRGDASATTSPSVPLLPVPVVPLIVADHIAFGATRRAETAAYAERHYGTRTAALDPSMVVLHFTESETYASVRSLFEADAPNRGELPGTCAHYVVDQDGTVHELVPPTIMCRHTVGLNHLAIGVEFVQSSAGHDPRWAAQQVLARKAQVAAGVALVVGLQRRFAIADGNVIGHAMANDAKGFRDLEGWRNDHLDWQAPEVARFRALLATAG